MPDFHPQDWITIVGALAIYDQWRDRDDGHAERIYAMQCVIAAEHGFGRLSEFIRQGEFPGTK